MFKYKKRQFFEGLTYDSVQSEQDAWTVAIRNEGKNPRAIQNTGSCNTQPILPICFNCSTQVIGKHILMDTIADQFCSFFNIPAPPSLNNVKQTAELVRDGIPY